MEVSIQPSYTFPSRKVYANRALGLQALINTQLVTTVPKRATDISLETGLQPTTTVPKVLDKDTIDPASVLPVVPPQYVQPGLAEGLTKVAQSQQFELQVQRVVSANNALKRGNYKSAESILGRQLSAEEIANKTVTPNVRQSESGSQVHVGNHGDAMGAKMRSGISKETQDWELRFAADPFFIDVASDLNTKLTDAQREMLGLRPGTIITPAQVARLKTTFGYVGDLDFSSYGHSQSRESRQRAVQGMYNLISQQLNMTREAKLEQEKLRQEYAGEQDRQNRNKERNANSAGTTGPDSAQQDQEGEEKGASAERDDGWADDDEKKDAFGDYSYFDPSQGPNRGPFMGDPFAGEAPRRAPPSQPVGGTAPPVRPAFDTEYFMSGSGPVPQQGIFGPDVAGRAASPVKQVVNAFPHPYLDPTVNAVMHPAYGDNDGDAYGETMHANAMEQAEVNVALPGTPANSGIAQMVDLLEEIKDDHERKRKGSLQGEFADLGEFRFADSEYRRPPARPRAEVLSSDAQMTTEQKAEAVLGAARGRRPRDFGALELPHSKAQRRHGPAVSGRAHERDPSEGLIRRVGRPPHRRRMNGERGGGIDVEALGAHHGNRRSYSARYDRGNPYVDDRFLPDTDGYDTRGAVVSGDMMRRTGTDAMAISAQLQVPETHQGTELPVRKFRQFPNMSDELRTDLIPIDIHAGRGHSRAGGRRGVGLTGRVPFGKYMLDLGKLSGGVVAMTHQSTGRKIHAFPNRTTTPGLTHALNQLVSGGAVNHKKLSHHDKLYVNRLVQVSGADVDLPTDVNMPPGEQLKVLVGEIDAGNDSPDIKRQLRVVVTGLKRMKQLSAEQAADITQHYL